jgi:hypothetical protein
MQLYLIIYKVHILLEWFLSGFCWPKLFLRLLSGHFLLIEAKNESITQGYITSYMPMAVSIREKKIHLIPTYSLLTPKIRGIRCSKMEYDGIIKVDFF